MNPTTQPLLPARMLNEFVYCPRLFYYEHVERVFVHNADTLEGKAAHKRVDGGKGALPKKEKEGSPPSGEAAGEESATADPEVIHSRSVNLFSETLGVTAKLDLVETLVPGEDFFSGRTLYRPVEYKKGRPREGEEGPEIWPADRMQLGLQVLLLRENGYPCDEGMLYYRETRQRVSLPLTDELEHWIHEQIEAARATAAGPLPAPLSHSRKCPRCSLVSICLPDETAYLEDFPAAGAPRVEQLGLDELLGEADASPTPETVDPRRLDQGPFAELPEIRLRPLKPAEDIRRLIAPNEETKTLYLNSPGHWVSKKGETLVVKEEGRKVADFRLHDLHHLAVFGPVQLSTAVVQVLCERDVPITWFTFGGWFYGMTRGHSLKNVFTRLEQFRAASDPAVALTHARLFVHGKILNQRTLLMRNHGQPEKGVLKAMKHLANSALYAEHASLLLGVEGSAALLYFSHFAGMVKDRTDDTTEAELHGQSEFSFAFDQRNRRPPARPGQRPALAHLQPPLQGLHRRRLRGRLRSLCRLPPPAALRKARARPRPHGGIPAPRGRLGGPVPDQQPHGYAGGLRMGGAERQPEARRPEAGLPRLRETDGRRHHPPGLRLQGELPAGGRAAGPSPRQMPHRGDRAVHPVHDALR